MIIPGTVGVITYEVHAPAFRTAEAVSVVEPVMLITILFPVCAVPLIAVKARPNRGISSICAC